MGGYAFFVWWSYGIALVVLLALIVSSLMQRKRVIARVKRAIRRDAMQAGGAQASAEQ